MYCPRCGAEGKEGAHFCAKCGKSLNEVQPVVSSPKVVMFSPVKKEKPLAEAQPAVYPSPAGEKEAPSPSPVPTAAKGQPTTLVVILVVVGLIFLVGAIFGLVILPKITKKVVQTGKAISEGVEKAANEAKALGMSDEEIRTTITQLADSATKQQAKEKLMLNRESAKPLLIEATSNRSYYVRWGAVETLRDSGYAVDYVPAYIADLKSNQSHNSRERDIRKAAAKWLGPAKDQRAVGPLTWSAKNDEYRGVRSQAKDSLKDYYGIK